MRPTPVLSTWEIVPAPNGQFRWAAAAAGDPGHCPGRPPLSSEALVSREETSPPSYSLPSMMDVLVQARPMLLEESGDGDDASVPMFRTGLGKSVSVSETSIQKARKVLGEGDDAIGGFETSLECYGKCRSFPALYTGSGKLVTANESSILKAAAILEEEDMCTGSEASLLQRNKVDVIPIFHTGLGRKVTIKESSIRKAVAVLEEENKGFEVGFQKGKAQSSSMFNTGSGKTVSLNKSSIMKAAAVLEVEESISTGFKMDYENRGKAQSFSMFNTGSEKSVSLNESSIRKAAAILDREERINTGFEMGYENKDKAQNFSKFDTGSGKSVSLNESSVRKAAAALQGGESINAGFEICSENMDKTQSFSMFNTGSGKSVSLKKSSIRKAAAVLEGEESIITGFEMGSENRSKAQSFSMFSTGSGKSVSLKYESSIRKAASVFEGQENINSDQPQKFAREDKCNFSNSLFQTASGRNVNLSSSGLLKATKLLGLEGKENLSNIQDINYPINQSTMTPSNGHDLCGKFSSNSHHKTIMASSITVPEVQFQMNDFHSVDFRSIEDNLDNGSSKRPLKLKNDSSNHASSPTTKFLTAGGRSVSVSNDALQRARNLLGDSNFGLLESIKKKRKTRYTSETLPSPCKSSFSSSLQCNDTTNFVPDQERRHSHLTENMHNFGNQMPHMQQAQGNDQSSLHNATTSLTVKCIPFGGPLDDISNVSLESRHKSQLSTDNRRLMKKSSISPFKKPRSSMFATPLRSGISCLSNGLLEKSARERHRTRISMHYPFRVRKLKIHEFFQSPPIQQNMVADLADEVLHMNTDRASTYKFCSTSGLHEIGVDNFWNMLLQVGASAKFATKEWVTNHYKWIVWKLASLERSYPVEAKSKYLTVPNVLEELKYRYEREVNYGHRSAIKKILDGDALPSSMMILCISAIHSKSKPKLVRMEGIDKLSHSLLAESNHISKIELTDGWYSLDAFLDMKLSQYLATGKLYVGQKLRVWGASLSGWVGPVSPLEASETVAFQIHVNGTYRVHWADTLGFCKTFGPPLAFRCIKSGGGMVPRTLVGITRLYPILYRERLPDGGFIVRTEVMEKKALHLYLQRQSDVVEGFMYEQQDLVSNVNDSDEGAKIYKILETSAEPEVLMADMSSEQLVSLSNYRAKQNGIRQSVMQKKIDKALKDTGLASRDVTPFMKVRVVGLTSKALNSRDDCPKEGLITIWNPTENQKVDLVEGNIYIVAGLMPLNSYTDILYLHGKGSSTTWKAMHSVHAEKFETFFCPRRSVILSKLGEVALASEFDIAAVVLHVGDVYISGCQKKQWVFVTDGYGCSSMLHESILAITFSLPIIDNDSTSIFSHHYDGNTVGFCNLIKRARDKANKLWVAEATECSTYTISYNIPNDSHLKVTAAAAIKWAKESCQIIQKLKERVLSIVDGDRGVEESLEKL